MGTWPLVNVCVCLRGVSGHFGRHLDLLIPSTNCNTRTALTVVFPSTSPSPPTSLTNSDRPPEPPRPSASSSSSSLLLQRLPLWHLPRTPTLHKILAPQQTPTRPPPKSVVRTWSTHVLIATLHIGLVTHLRIHRTGIGEPVPGAPTYARCIRLHCPHCHRTFSQRMGLFGRMRIHENGSGRRPDTPTRSSTPALLSFSLTPSTRAPATTTTTSVTDTDATDLSCPHCPHTSTSRIGLIGHLGIHRTETSEPVPEAPTYTRRILLHFPQCPCTRTHLFGHMRIH
nr:unnamed protein product [Spirometra erinaceieuropaei]